MSVGWTTQLGDGPLVACAIHDGHEIRPDVAECLRLPEATRLYEEDPYTGAWTSIAPTRIVATRSRFEVDLNRPRDKAVYITPADAWGLDVWKCTPPAELVISSLRAYDQFYAELKALLEGLVAKHGRVVVVDLHSYNHIRDRAGGALADPEQNPEINLGTGTMNRSYWSRIVERWLSEMRACDDLGRALDVRENVKFFGGQLPRWIHENFPHTACALAVEVKKFFMNEWTGELYAAQHQAIGAALERAALAVGDELERWKRERQNA
jgi:N-formylglutamate amidohydrolase